MALFRKTQKKAKKKRDISAFSEEELLKLSIQEKLKNYKPIKGRAEFNGVLVLPKSDRAYATKMEFEVFDMDR